MRDSTSGWSDTRTQATLQGMCFCVFTVFPLMSSSSQSIRTHSKSPYTRKSVSSVLAQCVNLISWSTMVVAWTGKCWQVSECLASKPERTNPWKLWNMFVPCVTCFWRGDDWDFSPRHSEFVLLAANEVEPHGFLVSCWGLLEVTR